MSEIPDGVSMNSARWSYISDDTQKTDGRTAVLLAQIERECRVPTTRHWTYEIPILEPVFIDGYVEMCIT